MKISQRQAGPGLLSWALLLVLAPAVLSGQQAKLNLPAGAEQAAAKAITRDALEGPIRFLSDDLLEGRGPGSRGDELTQAYLATTLQSLGYEPGAQNGQYLQTFEIVGIDAKMPATWEFKAGSQNVALKSREDFIAASGVQEPNASLNNAELVFVGYGIEAPEYQWNDFKGMDLKGKVLVMLNNDPDWDPKLFEGNRRLYYGRWTYKYESAARQGRPGPSSSTPPPRPATPGRSCRPPGPASSSSCRRPASPASRSRPGPPKTPPRSSSRRRGTTSPSSSSRPRSASSSPSPWASPPP